MNKHIAIVGAGTAGLAALKAILDLPSETRQFWSIVVFEQRHDVGGIWLPDPMPPHPPTLPATPLYLGLRTNNPHPAMTCPGFPFPPMTPLYPSHEYVLAYHQDYADAFGLRQYIRFNTTVLQAGWRGDESTGVWDVRTSQGSTGDMQASMEIHYFDHLVVASGHNHYPAVPDFPGSQSWLDSTPPGMPKRSILHSTFYRGPDNFENRTVLVVGGGSSGRDAVSQITPIARKTYISLKDSPTQSFPTSTTTATTKPPISHFTHQGLVFVDHTTVSDVDLILLATGYELRIPFLDAGGALRTDPHAKSPKSPDGYTGLTTNLRYLFPLHEMIFSLSSAFPPTALSFIGLPDSVPNFSSSLAQGLFVAHALANSSLLTSRGDLLAQLARHEDILASQGLDPYHIGHWLVGDGVPEDYQDRIVRFLKDNGVIPHDEKEYVAQWRRYTRANVAFLKRAWTRIESKGKVEERKWLEGVITEDDWMGLHYRMIQWEKEYERLA